MTLVTGSVDNTKCAIGWYVTHQGKAYGPVAFKDLKYEVSRGKLRPRSDFVWREGYKSWKHADEVDGLFGEQPESTEQDELIEEMVDDFFERKKWGGMSRRWFLVCTVALPMFMAAALLQFWDHITESQRMQALIFCISFAIGLFLYSMFRRLKNLAMSYMWAAALLLPLVNLWLGYRLFTCPAGYEERKDMDGSGWLLSLVYWFPLAALIGLAAFATIKSPEALLRLFEGVFGYNISL